MCFLSVQRRSGAAGPAQQDSEGKEPAVEAHEFLTCTSAFVPPFSPALSFLPLQSLTLSLHIKREGGSPTSPPRPSDDAHSDRYQVSCCRLQSEDKLHVCSWPHHSSQCSETAGITRSLQDIFLKCVMYYFLLMKRKTEN